jgi:hypothetical protein
MLYKDNEPYKLTKEELKEYGKKQVYLLMPGHARYDQQDKRVRKPNGIFMEPYYRLTDTENRTTEIRYVETAPRVVSEGGLSYNQWNPSQVEFPQPGRLIVDHNPEMNYFLMNHPLCETSPNRDTNKKSIFYPEDKAAKAAAAIKKSQLRYDALSLILDPSNALKMPELRTIFRNYPDLVGHEKNYNDEQIKEALRAKAEFDPSFFLKVAKSPKTHVKNIVNRAVAAKLIKYHGGKKQWLRMEDSEEKESILSVKQGEDPLNFLVDHLTLSDKKEWLKYLEEKLEPVEEPA